MCVHTVGWRGVAFSTKKTAVKSGTLARLGANKGPLFLTFKTCKEPC